MKILVTGAEGMLGRTIANHFSSHELLLTDIQEMDITDISSVLATMDEFRPDAIVHSAAMTQVDNCESKVDQAFSINAIGSKNMAIAAAKYDAHLVAISTDYVFNGESDKPYHEWDKPCPRTVYGKSKLAGEQAVRDHCPFHSIVRIAWLYGPGGPSFLHTMSGLLSQNGDPLRVVDDQSGNPTSTAVVAQVIEECLKEKIFGTVHGTCEGETTWYGFTCYLKELLNRSRSVMPCSTKEYPRPAPRPKNSRLENRCRRLHGLDPLPHWQEALKSFLLESPEG